MSAMARVPAADIEAAVLKALAVHNTSTAEQKRTDRSTVAANVARIEVRKNQLALRLKPLDTDADIDQDRARDPLESKDNDNGSLLLIPWCKRPSKKFRELLLPPSVSRHKVRPIKAERRAALLKSIAHGRAWLDEIITGTAQGVEAIVARHKCSVRHVNMTTSMALRDHQASRAVAGLEVSMPRSQLRVHRVPDDALGLADFSLSATTLRYRPEPPILTPQAFALT